MNDDTNTTLPAPAVTTEPPIVEIEGKRVITLAMMDKLHQRPEGTARKRFNDHKGRLIEGEDFYRASASEIRTRKIMEISDKVTEDITLLTESGYLMVVKSFTDDLAWEVQRRLVNGYFRARAVSVSAPAIDVRDPSQLASIAIQLIEVNKELTVRAETAEKQVEAVRPKVEAHDRIAEAFGTFCRSTAAKNLGIAPHTLIRWMRTNNWTFRRPGDKDDLAYQSKIAAGLLEHKVTTGQKPDGTEWTSTQVRVTPKGMLALAKAFPPAAKEVA